MRSKIGFLIFVSATKNGYTSFSIINKVQMHLMTSAGSLYNSGMEIDKLEKWFPTVSMTQGCLELVPGVLPIVSIP